MNHPEETTVTTDMVHDHDEMPDQQVADELTREMADLACAMFALLRPGSAGSLVKDNPAPGPDCTSAVVPVAVPMPDALPLPDVAMAPAPLHDTDPTSEPAATPPTAIVSAAGAASTGIQSIPVPDFTAPLDLPAADPGHAHAAPRSHNEPRTMSMLDEIGFLDD